MIRELLSTQLDRVMRVAPIASITLLVANLAVTMATAMSWRGGPVWAWALLTGVVLVALVLVFAHLWAKTWDMVRGIRRAQAIHDPTQVYQLMPWERVVWLHAMLPQMEHQASIGDAVGADSAVLRQEIKRLRAWESLGYIPRDEYPEHLRAYYWHQEAAL